MQPTSPSADVLPAAGPSRGLLSRLRVPAPTVAWASGSGEAVEPVAAVEPVTAPARDDRVPGYLPSRAAGIFARLLVEQEEAERVAQARRAELPGPRTPLEAAPSVDVLPAAPTPTAPTPTASAVTDVAAAPIDLAALHAELAALRESVTAVRELQAELRAERERAAALEARLEAAGEAPVVPSLRDSA